jgi:uncharacterized Ntn-hydrolase superfamily protein
MTWSILARDSHGRFGAAIASRFFAVGALCVHAQRGVGVLATQALMNPLYGPAGLALLAAGRTPTQVVAELTAADGGRSQRQLHVLAAAGEGAAHTGADCVDWCGHQVILQNGSDQAFSVAGNMLAGPQVLQATADAYRASASRSMAERLILAMQAGEAAGGDKRGKQSAALLIQGDEDRAELDLRVDDHLDPLPELQRLYEVSLQRFQPFVACLAGRHDPVGETVRSRIEARIEAFHTVRAMGAGNAEHNAQHNAPRNGPASRAPS